MSHKLFSAPQVFNLCRFILCVHLGKDEDVQEVCCVSTSSTILGLIVRVSPHLLIRFGECVFCEPQIYVLIIDDSMDSLIYRRKSLVRNIFSVYRSVC